MEKGINGVAKEALNRSNVEGFLCVDQKGLCLASEGVAKESLSGIFAALAQCAQKLEPGTSPVIQIESETRKILVQSKDQITTAIFKTNHQKQSD